MTGGGGGSLLLRIILIFDSGLDIFVSNSSVWVVLDGTCACFFCVEAFLNIVY